MKEVLLTGGLVKVKLPGYFLKVPVKMNESEQLNEVQAPWGSAESGPTTIERYCHTMWEVLRGGTSQRVKKDATWKYGFGSIT
jgi:hypothetical protein